MQLWRSSGEDMRIQAKLCFCIEPKQVAYAFLSIYTVLVSLCSFTTDDGAKRKSQGISRVVGIHHLGTMNVYRISWKCNKWLLRYFTLH